MKSVVKEIQIARDDLQRIRKGAVLLFVCLLVIALAGGIAGGIYIETQDQKKGGAHETR